MYIKSHYQKTNEKNQKIEYFFLKTNLLIFSLKLMKNKFPEKIVYKKYIIK